MSKKFSLILALVFSLNASSLEDKLKSYWLKSNPNLNIISLKIVNLNSNKNCTIINYPRLAKQGFFRANCNGVNAQFRFILSATSKVYRLKRTVLKDELISPFDLEITSLDFSKAPFNAVSNINQELRMKSKVRQGSILKTTMLMPNYLINKDDSVVGIIDDGGLSVFIDLIALQSGVKGQKIRLKNEQGKNLSGEIINSKQVLIR